MTHTPGPWRIKGPSEPIEYDLGGDYAIIAASTLIIGEVYSQIGTHFRIDAIDNARLIAAAPEMLEALKDAQDFIELYCKNVQYPPYRIPTYNLICSVIAKAEGSNDEI